MNEKISIRYGIVKKNNKRFVCFTHLRNYSFWSRAIIPLNDVTGFKWFDRDNFLFSTYKKNHLNRRETVTNWPRQTNLPIFLKKSEVYYTLQYWCWFLLLKLYFKSYLLFIHDPCDKSNEINLTLPLEANLSFFLVKTFKNIRGVLFYIRTQLAHSKLF